MNSIKKQTEYAISLDIGSTFTKAALFQVGPERLNADKVVRVPTSKSLEHGVIQALEELGCYNKETGKPTFPVYFSSSAKGGLHVVAVGIVPDLTLKVARLTALSAGARVTQSYGFKLTEHDVREIDALNPDIILFSGGTDGGNEAYVRHNGQLLAKLNRRPQIIYAGNRVMRGEIKEQLSEFPVHFVSNILPELDCPSVEEARDKICSVFLDTIVTGKGLDVVIKQLECNPLPTPLAVMQLVEAIRTHCEQWTDFCLIDMGGATTDFYSCHREGYAGSNVIYRGIQEPDIKRTVEGDLGIRCNAPSVMIAGSDMLQESNGIEALVEMMDYVDKICRKPGYLPKSEREHHYDCTLANICITHAIKRHVGTRKRVFTEQGETFVQKGKNLSDVKKMILTGGFLSGRDVKKALQDVLSQISEINRPEKEIQYLIPRSLHYYQDQSYLLPLLGNLVRAYPQRAAQTAIETLVSYNSNCDQPMETSH